MSVQPKTRSALYTQLMALPAGLGRRIFPLHLVLELLAPAVATGVGFLIGRRRLSVEDNFPTTFIDPKDKVRYRYRYADMMTPYDKLKSLSGAARALKPGVTFDQLDVIASECRDNEAVCRCRSPSSLALNEECPA